MFSSAFNHDSSVRGKQVSNVVLNPRSLLAQNDDNNPR